MVLSLAFAVCLAWQLAALAEDSEARVGREAAAQIEKEYKVLNDAQAAEKVQRIVQTLAAVSPRPEVKYTCKILDHPSINAFSLPGGYIYVTKGALGAVESDDELAAIIGHEMGHNCKKHALELMRREAKANARIGLAVLGALLAGGNVDPGQVALMGGLLKQAVLNGYGIKAEQEADREAVSYLRKSGAYNPVAVLTVLEGFARMEATKPELELGIFQTHPEARARVEAVENELRKYGIPLNRRPVLRSLVPKAEKVTVKDKEIGRLLIDDTVIFEPAVCENSLSPIERAQRMADQLHELLLKNLQLYEMHLKKEPGRAVVSARQQEIVVVLPGDAEFLGTTLDKVAEKVMDNIRMAFWADATRRAF
jgi:Zn-dependent protease with chaperone function